MVWTRICHAGQSIGCGDGAGRRVGTRQKPARARVMGSSWQGRPGMGTVDDGDHVCEHVCVRRAGGQSDGRASPPEPGGARRQVGATKQARRAPGWYRRWPDQAKAPRPALQRSRGPRIAHRPPAPAAACSTAAPTVALIGIVHRRHRRRLTRAGGNGGGGQEPAHWVRSCRIRDGRAALHVGCATLRCDR